MNIKNRIKDFFEDEVYMDDEPTGGLEMPIKHKYIFPNILAKIMEKVDQKAQYEASMMSIVFILVGVSWFIVYNAFLSPSTTAVRVMGIINLIAVFILLSSNLVTNFQQYQTYCQAMETFKDFQQFKNKNENS